MLKERNIVRTCQYPKTIAVSQFYEFINATFVEPDAQLRSLLLGPCQADISANCKGVEVGEAGIADCLNGIMAEEDSAAGATKTVVSKPCKEAVLLYKAARATNINKNLKLAKACKVDAEKMCNVTNVVPYNGGAVIACLRYVSADSWRMTYDSQG